MPLMVNPRTGVAGTATRLPTARLSTGGGSGGGRNSGDGGLTWRDIISARDITPWNVVTVGVPRLWNAANRRLDQMRLPERTSPPRPAPPTVPVYTPQQWVDIHTQAMAPMWADQESALRSSLTNLELARGALRADNRFNQQAYNLSQRQRQLDLANLDVEREANSRQRGYVDDFANAVARQHLLTLADIGVDENAARRQYGLIEAARGDTRRERERAVSGLLQELDVIQQREKHFKRTSRTEFRKQIGEAAARGHIGLLDSLSARDLRSAVELQLKEFEKQKDDNRRTREEVNDRYFTRMRELQEQWYATDDALKKIEIRREMERVEQEKRRMEAEMKRREIEENNRRLFLQAAALKLQQENDLLNLARQRENQMREFFAAVAAQQQAAARWAAAVNAGKQAGFAQALSTPIPHTRDVIRETFPWMYGGGAGSPAGGGRTGGRGSSRRR